VQGSGAGFSGSFYVTSVQHVLRPEASGCFAYGNSFSAVPASFVFRPERVTPPPRVPGLITGLVTNRNDPDQLGRVRVRFPTGVESNWARVTFALWGNVPSAGSLVPDVGDEVLVAFVGGDLRNPVVIGGLFNGDDRPPTNQD
jgi:uncharacterized protein involved in type VI secretion and phage assembly